MVMKTKGLKVVLAAIFLTCVMVGTSFATSYVTATVNRASTTDGDVALMLTYVSGGSGTPACTSFPAGSWFLPATANMDDQTLAVALTAVSLGKNIRIGVETCATSSVQGAFSQVGIDN